MSMTQDPEAMLAEMKAAAEEPLCEALAPYVVTSTAFPMVQHPLVHEILSLPGMMNRKYEHKVAAVEQAAEDGDWSTYVWLHARPYRTAALIEALVGRDEETGDPFPLYSLPEETRALAAQVWIDSENLEQYEEEWSHMLAGVPEGQMIHNTDPEGWAALPETLTVYRGECEDGGWSWSLDEKIAQFFANRFDAGHPLTVGTVAKSKVIAYFTSRGESEVLIYDASDVTVVETRTP